MTKNQTLIIFMIVIILLLVGLYIMNQWLVQQINDETSNYKAIKPATTPGTSVTQSRSDQAGDAMALEMEEGASDRDGDELLQETKDPVYEAPLENVILVQ
jgi:flagellar basal body-associated protein FliL